MSNNGIAELKISNGGYGGRFVFASNGDLALSIDTQDAAPATEERLARYALTNPRQVDDYGNPIARGDHPVYQAFGAGLGTFVGAQASPQTQSDIHSALAEQINGDPYILQDPAPEIDVATDASSEAIAVLVSVRPTLGGGVATSSIPLRQGV